MTALIHSSLFPSSESFVDLLTIAAEAPSPVTVDEEMLEAHAQALEILDLGDLDEGDTIPARGLALRLLGRELVNRLRVGAPRLDFDALGQRANLRPWRDASSTDPVDVSDPSTDEGAERSAAWYQSYSPRPGLIAIGRSKANTSAITTGEYNTLVSTVEAEAEALRALVVDAMGESAWEAARVKWSGEDSL